MFIWVCVCVCLAVCFFWYIALAFVFLCTSDHVYMRVRSQTQNKWLAEIPRNMSEWVLTARLPQHPSVSTCYRALLASTPYLLPLMLQSRYWAGLPFPTAPLAPKQSSHFGYGSLLAQATPLGQWLLSLISLPSSHIAQLGHVHSGLWDVTTSALFSLIYLQYTFSSTIPRHNHVLFKFLFLFKLYMCICDYLYICVYMCLCLCVCLCTSVSVFELCVCCSVSLVSVSAILFGW